VWESSVHKYHYGEKRVLKKICLAIISVVVLFVFQQSNPLYGTPINGEQSDPKEKEQPIKNESSQKDDNQQNQNPTPPKTTGEDKTNKKTANSKQKIKEQKKTKKKTTSFIKGKQEKQQEQQKKKPSKATKPPPFGYCCYGGTLRALSEQFCITKKGRFFSTSQKPEADKFCRRTINEIGFCCLANKIVVKLDKKRCRKRQGRYYSYNDRLSAYSVCRISARQQSQESERTGSQNIPTYRRLTVGNQTVGSAPIQSRQTSQQNRTEPETTRRVGRSSQAQQETPEEPVSHESISHEPVTVVVNPHPYVRQPLSDQFAHQNTERNQIVVSLDGAIAEQELLSRISKTFQLELIELFTLKSLGHRVAVFSTGGDTASVISELGRHKGVLSVQPNNVFTTMGEPMTAMQNLSRVIDFDVLHSRYRGKSIRIGIVDTGVDYSHHELSPRVVHHQNFFSESDYTGEIHGTAVAGIIGASINSRGVQGVAPEADLYAFRGCRQQENNSSMGVCFSTTIAKALDAAINNRVHLVSLCLGTSSSDKLVTALLEAGVDRDILFVAPAGNSADQPVLAFPASHEDVISVAGIDRAGKGLPNPRVAAMAAFFILTSTPNTYGLRDFGGSLQAAFSC